MKGHVSTPVIRCEGIGKRYSLGERQGIRSVREIVNDVLTGRVFVQEPAREEFLWAVRDISLEVRRGEVLGIIGKNGSGKSTLLKVLARITAPTEGWAEIRGRVGTLLEVGTGFHPELTGRENIWLNGAVLGMHKPEIARKFDEIVAFSEIEAFLDVPVKRYSSGMYTRLAFSVAAHLESEILFVDEVLAVGDVTFQAKCLGKMSDAAHQGRTVLFVSHNLLAVESLCTRAICLQDGKAIFEGRPRQVVNAYLDRMVPAAVAVTYQAPEQAPGNHVFRLRRAGVRPLAGSPGDALTVRTPFVVEVEYWKLRGDVSVEIWVEVYNEHGVHLFVTGWQDRPAAPAGLLRSSFVIPGDFMNNGLHHFQIVVSPESPTDVFHCPGTFGFEIRDTSEGQREGTEQGDWNGAVRPLLQWKCESIESGAGVVGEPQPIALPQGR